MVLPLAEIMKSTGGTDSVGKTMLCYLHSESCNQNGSNFIPLHSANCYSIITNVFYNKLTSYICCEMYMYVHTCMHIYICIYNIK